MIPTPMRQYTNLIIKDIVKKYCPKEGAIILDAGCGAGRYAKFFQKLGIKGTYLGTDIKYRSTWKDYNEKDFSVKYKEYNSELIDNLGMKFNFIVSLQSFEHVKNDLLALLAFKKSLLPKGKILITIPSRPSVLLYGIDHCYRYYSREDMLALADGAGLNILELKPVGGFFGFMVQAFFWNIPQLILRGGYENIPDYEKFLQQITELAYKIDSGNKKLDTLEGGWVMIMEDRKYGNRI